MKKRNKVIIIILIIVVVAGGGLYYFNQKNKGQVEYTTAKVVRQNLKQTVSATGQIKSAEEISLNFAGSGRVTAVKVRVGDKVKSGQILAQLDSSDLSVQLQQYQANLASAEANLAKLLAGVTTENKKVAEEQVNSAAVAYEASVTDLNNAQTERDENMTIYKETALNDLDNYLFKARASLDKVRIAYEDPMGKDYISIRDPQYLINAKVQRDDALRMLDTSEQLVNQAKMVKSYDSIITALDSLDLGLDQVALTLDSMFNALLNSLTTPTFPESSLETLKTSIKAEQTTTTGGIAALQLDKSNLQTKKLYYDNAVVAAENVMKIKKQAWELAKAQYGATVADPKPSDVDYYQALVDQARAQVAAVRQKMSDRAISAPVNGVVTKVNNKVGELSSLTAPVLIMLGDQDYEIEVDVPESDIAKISVGDDASLTLDAFGEDIKFTGKIVLIEPAQTEISGVIYYKVKINLDKTDKDIKPGMTANVDILAAEKNDVLVIPQRAIVDDKVKVLVDPQTKKVEEKSVVVGLKGDDGLAEIVSGLNEGEEVVTYTKNGTK